MKKYYAKYVKEFMMISGEPAPFTLDKSYKMLQENADEDFIDCENPNIEFCVVNIRSENHWFDGFYESDSHFKTEGYFELIEVEE